MADDLMPPLSVVSEEVRAKLRAAAKRRPPVSDETRAKMSASGKASQWRRRRANGVGIGIGIGGGYNRASYQNHD